MSGEIKIPCRVWPSRNANQNGTYDHFVKTYNVYISEGIRCPVDLDTDLFWRMTVPIPAAIHGTPAGKIRVTYLPEVTAGAVRLIIGTFSITAGTTSIDPSALDEADTTDDTVIGANIEQEHEVALGTAAQTDGLVLAGSLTREGSHDNDSNAGDIGIMQILYVANSA